MKLVRFNLFIVPILLVVKKVFWALDEYFSIATTLASLNVELNFKENR